MSSILDLLGNLPALVGFGGLINLSIGLSIGVLIGALPGVGPLLGVVMAIPFTYYMDPVPAMALLMGIYQGGSYGGALSATILGIPGTPLAASTLLDARPMALRGKASEAVTLSTIGSSAGGIFSALILIAVAPWLAKIALKFGPAETAAFALLGLTTLGALSGGSPLKGWMMGFVGLAIATIGLDPMTGVSRFGYGSIYLDSGVQLVPMLVGIFALSEVAVQAEHQVRAHDAKSSIGTSVAAFSSLLFRPFTYLRAATMGVFIGILPGLGGVSASFLSYRVEKIFKRSSDPEFGQGNPSGVIACETSNSAVTGGALIPMLSLSIPGDPIVAVLMGGLLLQGVVPGPRMFLTDPHVVQGIFAVFLVGSILLLPIGLMFIRAIIRVLVLPQWAIMSCVVMISLVGTYAVQREILDIYVLIFFGFVGYVFRKFGFPLSPIVIGFVLGPIFEEKFRRTVLISQGDLFGYLLSRPIALTVLIVVALFVILPLVGRMVRKTKSAPSIAD